MTAEEINAHPKKRGWKGVKAIAYEVKDGRCITPCPYKQKTPSQKVGLLFKEQGVDFGVSDDCAKVGSKGCGCCWYNLGHTEFEHILLCGYEAKKTIKKADSLGLECGRYKIPRNINKA